MTSQKFKSSVGPSKTSIGIYNFSKEIQMDLFCLQIFLDQLKLKFCNLKFEIQICNLTFEIQFCNLKFEICKPPDPEYD